MQPFLAENNTKTQTFSSDRNDWRFYSRFSIKIVVINYFTCDL